MEFGLTVGDSIERIAETDSFYDFIELSIGDHFLPPESIDRTQLQAALADKDLYVHLPFDQILATHVPELNTAIVDYQTRLLDEAADLGATKAVLHGTIADRDDVDLRETFIDQLRHVVEAGERVGIEVVVENVGHQHRGIQLSVLAEVVRETDVPVCFDIGHAYMEAGNDGIERFLRSHAHRISHLHVHDARRRGDTHIPVGAGEIDYSKLVTHLTEFDDSVAVEVFTNDRGMLRDSTERIKNHLH